MMLSTEGWPYFIYGYTRANRDTDTATGIPKTAHAHKPGAKVAVGILEALGLSPPDLALGWGRNLRPAALVLLREHVVADWREVAAGVDKPVLMTAARAGDDRPCGHASACARRRPRVRAVVMAQCGPAANIGRPDEFNRVLLEVVRSLP
jgi:pimeloyl-ACP methyl ester carboxylesterase